MFLSGKLLLYSTWDVGTEYSLYYFQQLCGFVAGLDNARNMLAENPCPRVVQCGATDLPFPDGSFDVAFEANLLHHVEDRTKVVREMARVSRRWVVLIEPNRYNPLMLAFGLVVPAERGLLTSTKASNLAIVREVGLKPISWMTTGMISQNNTPSLPLFYYQSSGASIGRFGMGST